ncbi:hypothetical protein B0T16DRAFT_384316 [Cercophora newfieldiana]|uniref:Uncharacterized protein n=1 Tax=Cercophora newfieldiana TaxID=92897 RepID=A0AA39YPK6_9PEZI|nr:hypothetical protein B0T16DRAFT_384316 [Cercophora newfieldiana]
MGLKILASGQLIVTPYYVISTFHVIRETIAEAALLNNHVQKRKRVDEERESNLEKKMRRRLVKIPTEGDRLSLSITDITQIAHQRSQKEWEVEQRKQLRAVQRMNHTTIATLKERWRADPVGKGKTTWNNWFAAYKEANKEDFIPLHEEDVRSVLPPGVPGLYYYDFGNSGDLPAGTERFIIRASSPPSEGLEEERPPQSSPLSSPPIAGPSNFFLRESQPQPQAPSLSFPAIASQPWNQPSGLREATATQIDSRDDLDINGIYGLSSSGESGDDSDRGEGDGGGDIEVFLGLG